MSMLIFLHNPQTQKGFVTSKEGSKEDEWISLEEGNRVDFLDDWVLVRMGIGRIRGGGDEQKEFWEK